MLKLAVCAALLAGCATGELEQVESVEPTVAPLPPPFFRVTYFLAPEPGCAPEPDTWEAAASAFAAWQAFGVEVVESSEPVAPSPDAVAVCFHDGPYWTWHVASVAWSEAGMRMDLRADMDQAGRHSVLWALAAHELGHVVLATNAHSPESGGLLSTYACSGCQDFTQGDVAWVESHGLVLQRP